MSIWASRFTLDTDHPLGPPYAVDYAPSDEPAPAAWVDLATTTWAPGWVRLLIYEEDGTTTAEVMLNPAQAAALGEALRMATGGGP